MDKDLTYVIEHYKKFYPQYTLESLEDTIKVINERHEKIDAITLDFYLREIIFGGLGYGIKGYEVKEDCRC